MPSFQVPVLGFAVRFLSPYPDSLPQLFLRCFPSFPLSLLFRAFRFPSGSFRPLLLRFQLLSFLFLPFLLFPVPPLSCFPGARFRFRFFAFLFLSGLISHAFLPGSCTRPSVCFLLPFPDSLPTAVPQVLPFFSAFASLPGFSASLPVSFVPFCSASGYSASVFPFLFLPVSASQWLPRCDLSAFASLAFPRSFLPGFPCFLSRFFVLGFLFVSFHPSRFRSHSRSTGASLLFRFLSSASLPGFPLAFCFLSSASARF